MTSSLHRKARFLLLEFLLAAFVLIAFVEFAQAGGPKYIAGVGYFNAGLAKSSATHAGRDVVARWIDPSTGQPSGQYAISSVSGFAFTGNAGNPITGFNDVLGQPLNRFGSTDTNLEGFFDMAGLIIPKGNAGQVQISVEALDPLRSQQVGPYSPWQVQPSGGAQPITLNVNVGDDIAQDILMQGSAQQDAATSRGSYSSPLPVPQSGVWTGTLSPYGDIDYFSFMLNPAEPRSSTSLRLMRRASRRSTKLNPPSAHGPWPTLPELFLPG